MKVKEKKDYVFIKAVIIIIAILLMMAGYQKCESFYEGTERYDGVGDYY